MFIMTLFVMKIKQANNKINKNKNRINYITVYLVMEAVW